MSLLKRHGSSKAQRPRKILLVDEFPVIRGGLTALVKNTVDLKVCAETDSPSQALPLIRSHRPDIVVLELLFQGRSVFDLIGQIRREHPRLPILIFSSQKEFFFAQRALDEGADGYLLKHEQAQAILEALRSLLEGRIYVSPHLIDNLTLSNVPLSGKKGLRGIQKMSNRELQIFQLLGEGQSTRQIAGNLVLSVKTIETYCARLKSKLNIRNSSELLRSATYWTAKTTLDAKR